MIDAVVFDLDGVLLDSEPIWERAREALTRDSGGRWHQNAQREMMGMSSLEWSGYMRDRLRVPMEPVAISAEVVRRMQELYRERLPLLPGARAAVERLSRWPLAVASSSNRELIDLALELSGLARRFGAAVSSEEVPHGKPSPDVYLEAARRLGADARRSAAVEDSQNGILSARAAGMRTVAIPNAAFPPGPEAMASADVVLRSLDDLEPDVVDPGR